MSYHNHRNRMVFSGNPRCVWHRCEAQDSSTFGTLFRTACIRMAVKKRLLEYETIMSGSSIVLDIRQSFYVHHFWGATVVNSYVGPFIFDGTKKLDKTEELNTGIDFKKISPLPY